MYKCGICGKEFILHEEGRKFVHRLENGTIPNTTYVCLECIKKQINKNKKEFDNTMKRIKQRLKIHCK